MGGADKQDGRWPPCLFALCTLLLIGNRPSLAPPQAALPPAPLGGAPRGGDGTEAVPYVVIFSSSPLFPLSVLKSGTPRWCRVTAQIVTTVINDLGVGNIAIGDFPC